MAQEQQANNPPLVDPRRPFFERLGDTFWRGERKNPTHEEQLLALEAKSIALVKNQSTGDLVEGIKTSIETILEQLHIRGSSTKAIVNWRNFPENTYYLELEDVLERVTARSAERRQRNLNNPNDEIEAAILAISHRLKEIRDRNNSFSMINLITLSSLITSGVLAATYPKQTKEALENAADWLKDHSVVIATMIVVGVFLAVFGTCARRAHTSSLIEKEQECTKCVYNLMKSLEDGGMQFDRANENLGRTRLDVPIQQAREQAGDERQAREQLENEQPRARGDQQLRAAILDRFDGFNALDQFPRGP